MCLAAHEVNNAFCHTAELRCQKCPPPSLAEATFSHIDDSGSQRRIAFYTHCTVQCKQTAATICMRSRHPRSHTHADTHSHTHLHILTYLSSSDTRTHTPKTPHRTCDCRLFYIHMRLYKYKIIKPPPPPKKKKKILSITSPGRDSSDTRLSFFISLRRGQV